MSGLAHLLLTGLAALTLTAAPPTAAANERAAHRDTAQLLRLVVLPPGARRIASAPGRAGGLFGHPPELPGGKLVDRHLYWRVPEPFRSVVAFVKTHPPRGSRKEGVGSTFSGGPGIPRNETLVFAFPDRPGRLSNRALLVTMGALPGGATGIRVDAQAVWVVPRPRSAVLPDGVRSVVLASLGRSHRTSDRAKVAKIVRWFDALPIVQPGVSYACPALAGPEVTLEFDGAHRTVLARASLMNIGGLSSTCNPIRWSVGRRTQKPLVGGRFLLRVEKLLGISLGPRPVQPG